MKKKVILILAVTCLIVLAMLPTFSSCTKRENVLKVLSWDEYIDEELISEFEDYYQSVTGKKVRVEYQTVETNEVMYTKIAQKGSDYDIVCPSDYMVEKMYNEGLLLKLDKTYLSNTTDYTKNISPIFTDKDGKFNNVNPEYVCAYMWGTLGIVYNRSIITTEEIKSQGWNALFNNKYSGKIDMKDSVRDSYVAAALVVYKDAIEKGEMTVAQAINSTSNDALNKVKTLLINQKQNVGVYSYETDNGKTNIVEGRTNLLLQWSGDAVYTLSEDFQKEVLNDKQKPDLAYYAPVEGGNLWCDYWVIPKNAVNLSAANLWINFMCKDSSAIKNMEFIGYTTAIATPSVLEYAQKDPNVDNDPDRYDYADLSYFFNGLEDAKNVYTDIVQFPNAETMKNAEVMKDFGDRTAALYDMWSAVGAATAK